MGNDCSRCDNATEEIKLELNDDSNKIETAGVKSSRPAGLRSVSSYTVT
jgi:hypothetical protein